MRMVEMMMQNVNFCLETHFSTFHECRSGRFTTSGMTRKVPNNLQNSTKLIAFRVHFQWGNGNSSNLWVTLREGFIRMILARSWQRGAEDAENS